jgi:hypothetical protein
MRHSKVVAALGVAFALSLLGGCSSTPEQQAARQQRKMEKAEFVKTHEYDHVNNRWIAKGGGPAVAESPPDLKSREQVKAERDAFLSKNRWDNVNSVWIPVSGPPRELSTLPREQVRAETDQFLRTHTYDEMQEAWIEKK